MLHSVATLSKVFEKKFNKNFPFPPILFTIQDFEHELGSNTPESYLNWVLEEKDNSNETEVIQKYNETVRVVKKFPDFGEPRILLMSHPHRPTKISKLPNLLFQNLDNEYKQQVLDLKILIQNRLQPKSFNFIEVNGEFIANLARELVHTMNTLDNVDVGPALVRELAQVLMKSCFDQYVHNLTQKVELPQDVSKLEQVHSFSKVESLNLFVNNCTGGVDSYDNKKSYDRLIEMIDQFYLHHVKNNTYQSEIFCTKILTEKFNDIRFKYFESIENFDLAIQEVLIYYQQVSKGPLYIKNKVKQSFMSNDVLLKRELVMRENSQKDFKQIMSFLLVLCLFLFIISIFIKSDIIQKLYTLFLIMTVLVVMIFHNILGIDEVIKFEHIQSIFNIFRGTGSFIQLIIQYITPIIGRIYSIISPIIRPYQNYMILILVMYIIIYYFKQSSEKSEIQKHILEKAIELVKRDYEAKRNKTPNIITDPLN